MCPLRPTPEVRLGLSGMFHDHTLSCQRFFQSSRVCAGQRGDIALVQTRYTTSVHKMRSRIASFIRQRRWVPFLISMCLMAAFATSAWIGLNRTIVIFVGAACAATCLFWGYAYRAVRVANCPSLGNLHRRQYAETWDTLASSPEHARAAASGAYDEENLRLSARRAVNNIIELAGINPVDYVLEIGCGVARIGLELAPRCQHWTGADISKNMLAYAADRLSKVGNIRLVHLQAANLDVFPDSSFDLVYLTNMFDHLDQLDRYKYILDACRVL